MSADGAPSDRRGLLKLVIDRSHPLEDIAAARRSVEQGHKRVNVILRTT